MMCCSFLWCRMSSPSSNTKMHGCVIHYEEYAFRVSIEMEWLWVTMTNTSDWRWQKVFEQLVRYSFVPQSQRRRCVTVLCVSFVCVDGAPLTLRSHKTLKCWQMCLCVFKLCVTFFPLGLFLDHCSSFFITLNKQTCYSMISLTLTYHQHTITISFTPNQRQKCSSNEKVAHDGFKHHEYQTRKHETRPNNSE